jgi:hypothetical protein
MPGFFTGYTFRVSGLVRRTLPSAGPGKVGPCEGQLRTSTHGVNALAWSLNKAFCHKYSAMAAKKLPNWVSIEYLDGLKPLREAWQTRKSGERGFRNPTSGGFIQR